MGMDIKHRVREWLGLEETKKMIEVSFSNTLSQQEAIHKYLVELYDQCQRIEQKLSINHLDKPVDRVSSTSYDWDTVQLMRLQEMQKNPPKEN
jgi:adenylate kinase family enzyme